MEHYTFILTGSFKGIISNFASQLQKEIFKLNLPEDVQHDLGYVVIHEEGQYIYG